MRQVGLALALCGAMIGFSGCGTQTSGSADNSSTPAAHGGLAVIDLDRVAASLGREQEMEDELKQRQASLNDSLRELHQKAREEFDLKKQEYGEKPTDEQQQELQRIQNQLNTALANSQRKAQISLEVHKQELISKFRGDVRPIAQEIAASRGLSVVIPKNDGLLLSIDPGVDITSQVIERMQAKPTAKPAAATPAPQTSKAPENTRTR